MKILLMIVALAFLAGCAGNPTEGMTEAEIVVWESQAEDRAADREYDRQEKEDRRLEEFWDFSRQCRAAGGFVVIKRWHSIPRRCMRQVCPPERYDHYHCGSLR